MVRSYLELENYFRKDQIYNFDNLQVLISKIGSHHCLTLGYSKEKMDLVKKEIYKKFEDFECNLKKIEYYKIWISFLPEYVRNEAETKFNETLCLLKKHNKACNSDNIFFNLNRYVSDESFRLKNKYDETTEYIYYRAIYSCEVKIKVDEQIYKVGNISFEVDEKNKAEIKEIGFEAFGEFRSQIPFNYLNRCLDKKIDEIKKVAQILKNNFLGNNYIGYDVARFLYTPNILLEYNL
jgi:hypothetical protein